MTNTGAKVVTVNGAEYLVIWDAGDVRIFTNNGSYIFGGNIGYTMMDCQSIGDVILFIGVYSNRSAKTLGWNPVTKAYNNNFSRYVD